MNEERRQARVAGLLRFLVALIAPYGLMVVPARLLVAGDAQATAQRMAVNPGVLRLGMATEVLLLGGATRGRAPAGARAPA